MLRKITGIIISLLLVSLTACSVSVDFTTLDFGSTETSKTFTLTIQGTVEWSINCNESWVTINPDTDQGQGLDNINVTVDRTGLAIGDYEAAFNHLDKFHLIKSEVIGEEATNVLKELETKHATEKSEKEKEIHRLKNVELKKAHREISGQKEEIWPS